MHSEQDAEAWKTIPSYDDYEASSLGRIRRRTPHHRRPQANPAGQVIGQILTKHLVPRKDGSLADESRWSVDLWVRASAKRKRFLVSRLVCEAFHGPAPSPDHQAAHNNGFRLQNDALNLRWATCAENQADKLIHGTNNNGERHGMARLCAATVIAIRQAVAAGQSQRQVARDFGVSQANVSLIHTRKAWGHLL